MGDKLSAIVWFLFGVMCFIGFAYDIENDRDFFTWLWLLNSLISFLWFSLHIIKGTKKTYTRDEVVKIIYSVLTSTGRDIKTTVHHSEGRVEFDGDDLDKWIENNLEK